MAFAKAYLNNFCILQRSENPPRLLFLRCMADCYSIHSFVEGYHFLLVVAEVSGDSIFFLINASNPHFCVPSQLVSWSAHPFEPPRETYMLALHDSLSMSERKFLTMGSV